MNGDLFGYVPPERPRREPAQHRPWPTDAECRVKERVLERFKAWLMPASLETLQAADPDALARQYPPLEAWDIRQMIEVRLRGIRRR